MRNKNIEVKIRWGKNRLKTEGNTPFLRRHSFVLSIRHLHCYTQHLHVYTYSLPYEDQHIGIAVKWNIFKELLRFLVSLLRLFPLKVCMGNSFRLISNWNSFFPLNSSRFSIVAYNHMKVHIVWQFDQTFFEGVIALCHLEYFIRKLLLHLKWDLLKTACLLITRCRTIYYCGNSIKPFLKEFIAIFQRYLQQFNLTSPEYISEIFL